MTARMAAAAAAMRALPLIALNRPPLMIHPAPVVRRWRRLEYPRVFRSKRARRTASAGAPQALIGGGAGLPAGTACERDARARWTGRLRGDHRPAGCRR